MEIIGIGRVEKIVIENDIASNLLTIDTKDSKYLKLNIILLFANIIFIY